MAQRGIREYDAKTMRSSYLWVLYEWYLYEWSEDETGEKLEKLTYDLRSSQVKQRVVKPDQLFGKRWKHGLLGVNLTTDQVIDWIQEKNGTTVTLGKSLWMLHTFLVEPFVAHEINQEYYISFETQRDVDRINFSIQWWVEIEEVWESVRSVEVDLESLESRIQNAECRTRSCIRMIKYITKKASHNEKLF